ncbi:MAG: ATP-binding protein [Collinsella sp.]
MSATIPDRALDRAKVMELSNCTWVDAARNLIITGASGAGKSWMACALGVAACNAFKTVRYVRLPELLDTLCIAKGETWAKMRKRYIACDLLIVDDWLLETISPSQTREVLEIVEARHRKGSLILCSQFAPSGWRAKLGDNAMADAVVDRLVFNSHDAHRGHRIHEEEDVRHNLSAKTAEVERLKARKRAGSRMTPSPIVTRAAPMANGFAH